MLAHRIAVLDHLLKGRFYWGVGAGSFIGDFEAFGINPKTGEQRQLMNESLEMILKLWNEPEPGRLRQFPVEVYRSRSRGKGRSRSAYETLPGASSSYSGCGNLGEFRESQDGRGT